MINTLEKINENTSGILAERYPNTEEIMDKINEIIKHINICNQVQDYGQ